MLITPCLFLAALNVACHINVDASEHAGFADPIRIKAAGQPIDVTTGHAAPYIYDIDGDGISDLLVGEFGALPYKGPVSEAGGPGHEWVQGRLRIYKNHGTNQVPKYESFEYMKAGDEIAAVPITCCVSFVPHVVDFDGDGIDDIISGSYPGDMYFFKRNSDGSFQSSEHLKNVDGQPLHAMRPIKKKYQEPNGPTEHSVHSITIEAHDMDGDQDLDLVIGSRLDGCYTIENIGSRSTPLWSTETRPLVTASGDPIGGWDYGSNVHFSDWDGDGVSDIIVGSENGGVYWHRNEGKEHKPLYGAMQTLISEPTMDQMFHRQSTPPIHGSRVKVHAADYNGDGHTDLLVGDFGSTWHPIKTLTDSEVNEKQQLEKEQNTLYELLEPVWSKDEADYSQQEQSNMNRADEIAIRLEALETHRHDSHGWVWLYTQSHSPPVSATKINELLWETAGSSNGAMNFLFSNTPANTELPIKIGLRVHVDAGTTVGASSMHVRPGATGYLSQLTWDLPENATMTNVTWPKPKTISIAGTNSSVYDHTFTIWAEIQLPTDRLPNHSHPLQATLQYQTCSKRTGVCSLKTATAHADFPNATQKKDLQ
ncbi:MAG: FG-GAP-like repeat-containing protein [Phycisphaerales bacterium]|nr:FG-GAP-like repeat-containing protein [Phycisphaerales bacterium]